MEMEFLSTVSAWNPPAEFVWTLELDQMESVQSYRLDEVSEGTRITVTGRHRLKGLFMTLISPFLGWQIRTARAKEMAKLGQLPDDL